MWDSKKFARLWEQGISTKKLGHEFGKARNTISYWARQAGLKPRRSSHNPFGAIEDATIKKLWREGDPIADIAAKLNREPHVIVYRIGQLGLKPRGKGWQGWRKKRYESIRQRQS